jgi:hypothetical protein
MFEHLLNADVVIADLSTSNANALYQLGVRHVLRPRTTILIAESRWQPPFEPRMMEVIRFEHLGEGINYEEVERMRPALKALLMERMQSAFVDSPVYAFLSPSRPSKASAAVLSSGGKPRCFVVMGFGEKTDHETGRVLDLDQSYRMIKSAVQKAGLECVRADEIAHSGVIDLPMFDQLLTADVVIADLSTSNAQALYDLGVRHALRPSGTIVIAEDKFRFPFDIAHIVIRQYQHLGKDIGYRESLRMEAQISEAITATMQRPIVDSPVYRALPQWTLPPEIQVQTPAASQSGPDSPDTAALLRELADARNTSDWPRAVRLARMLSEALPSDPYVIQQLAAAIYKGKQPDPQSALNEAKDILTRLNPSTTTDVETLGLWAAIHKRLWDHDREPVHLDEAIAAYRRAFEIKEDDYSGINLAFLLDVRGASASSRRRGAEDYRRADETRHRVIAICEATLQAGVKGADERAIQENTFWVRATLAEALLGVGETERAKVLEAELVSEAPAPWMAETLREQLKKVRDLAANRRPRESPE